MSSPDLHPALRAAIEDAFSAQWFSRHGTVSDAFDAALGATAAVGCPNGCADLHPVARRARKRAAEEGIPIGSDNPTMQAMGSPPLHTIAACDCDDDGMVTIRLGEVRDG